MGLVSFLITSCINEAGGLVCGLWEFRDYIPDTKAVRLNAGMSRNTRRIV